MTRQQALISHLLTGGKLSIMNGYKLFGISNISREVRRLIEIPFNVILTRKEMKGKTKYGTACQWLEYQLTNNKINAKGIKLMKQVLSKKETTSGQNVSKSETKCNQLTRKDGKKVVIMKAKP